MKREDAIDFIGKVNSLRDTTPPYLFNALINHSVTQAVLAVAGGDVACEFSLVADIMSGAGLGAGADEGRVDTPADHQVPATPAEQATETEIVKAPQGDRAVVVEPAS